VVGPLDDEEEDEEEEDEYVDDDISDGEGWDAEAMAGEKGAGAPAVSWAISQPTWQTRLGSTEAPLGPRTASTAAACARSRVNGVYMAMSDVLQPAHHMQSACRSSSLMAPPPPCTHVRWLGCCLTLGGCWLPYGVCVRCPGHASSSDA
jgi:hypothetical protein